MVSKYTPGQSLEVVRNPHYWAGPAYLDGITFTWPAADQTKLQALQNGDLDVAVISNPVTIYGVLSANLGGYLWIRYIGQTLSMNGRQGHRTSDQNVRQAVAYAINPEAINQRVFQGKAIASSTLFPSGDEIVLPSGPPDDPAKATQLVDTVKKSTGWDGSINSWRVPNPSARLRPLRYKHSSTPSAFELP